MDLRSISSPELGQAEVASLLLTGGGSRIWRRTMRRSSARRCSAIFRPRSSGSRAGRSGSTRFALAALIPNLRRDPTESETDLDPTTRLTFGKSLRPGLNLTFSQSLRDSDAQAWMVDYVLRRGLELRLVSDDEDLRSYGFRHDLSFGVKAVRFGLAPWCVRRCCGACHRFQRVR